MADDKSCMLYFLFFLNVISNYKSPVASSQELVSCRLGQIGVLPCHYEGQLDQVDWSQLPEGYNVHVYVDGKDKLRNQLPLYINRTSLSEGLSRGDASLLLSEVSLKDQGLFSCFIDSDRDQSQILELRVFAPVSQVSIEQEGQQLLCRSDRIYPEPEVSWSPPFDRNTSVTESENGLFSVSSFVNLTESVEEYSCNVSTEHSWRSATYRTTEMNSFSVIYLAPAQEGVYTCVLDMENQTYIIHIEIKEDSTIWGFIRTIDKHSAKLIAIFGLWTLFMALSAVPEEVKLHGRMTQGWTYDELKEQKEILRLTIEETDQIKTLRDMLRDRKEDIRIRRLVLAEVVDGEPERQLEQAAAATDNRNEQILHHLHLRVTSD